MKYYARPMCTASNMRNSLFAFPVSKFTKLTPYRSPFPARVWPKCRQPSSLQRRYSHNPADDPKYHSIVDNPAVLVRSGRKHGPGLIVLCKYPWPIMPGSSSDIAQYLSHASHLASGHGKSSGFNGRQT